ncbi:bifunctional demethylmenaquinone methyltransferase/2-methoxy-6-polyprenyl-1,4-benzoquinol methylase UbiE [Flavihumibacter cheonanensis]|uniref:bifunctional demethylmenaquinone methyltransferase/2-methoxy-6-polyprenyl-1,4-benzoquinol methylase UbiE n=1 Tax=Flavihumibacter cheonanensis TaxID=1442385 RepID=UPI001EF76A16|nr:bifunctional demethylmenaquinone methyltransferase/2-methoxy-6-polyprenyl-1,4-benzoquinol methylase UbiE [Flavihumibacter cheonanensis]MCG7753579.1 bifunctional demethylmenaquinone methyltransferase/2-methoxy-6-polyprenyl-1,4-benzoquinol methylase UbiE [Flavihumibacter cheonanensis]
MNSPLPHDTIVPFGDENKSKKEQVAEMFDQIAFRYDFLNRFLSGGIDVRWRKKAIRELQSIQPKTVLDVATGTADVALMTYKYLQPDHITGIDISNGMLDIGRQKIARLGLEKIITLQQADSEALPFSDNQFDAITVAFGVRNFQNLHRGLAEMLRVLKPGGKLVVLEFSKPKTVGFKSLYKFYMNLVTPGIGKLIAKNKSAYQYLNDSVQAFPEGDDFLKILSATGFETTYRKPLTMGISTIYAGTKAML